MKAKMTVDEVVKLLEQEFEFDGEDDEDGYEFLTKDKLALLDYDVYRKFDWGDGDAIVVSCKDGYLAISVLRDQITIYNAHKTCYDARQELLGEIFAA